MGVSTDGILFWGYCWSDEGPIVPDDWANHEAVRRGHVDPWKEYPDWIEKIDDYQNRRKASDDWCAEHRKELDVWYEVRKEIENEFDCVDGYHCSGDYPLLYIAVKESRKSASRGYPVQLVPDDLTVGPDWKEKLDGFCAMLNIEPEGEPGWWLASYWG